MRWECTVAEKVDPSAHRFRRRALAGGDGRLSCHTRARRARRASPGAGRRLPPRRQAAPEQALLRLPRGPEAEGGAPARHGGVDPQGGRQRPGDRAGQERREPAHRGGHRPARAGGCRRRAKGSRSRPRRSRPLEAWIDAGGRRPADERPQADPRQHWAFRPPVRPPVPSPSGDRADWVRNPIDAFLAAEHEQRGLTPAPRRRARRRCSAASTST